MHWNKGMINTYHNERDEEMVKSENEKKFHIDSENKFGKSYHENLLKTDLKEAYENIFGDSIEEYNKKQKRKDRRISIDDYMQQIKDDNRGKKQTKRGNDGKRIVDDKAVRQGKQLSYEVHCCVGNTEVETDENGRKKYTSDGHEVRHEELPRDIQEKVLKQYAEEFQERNPNFVLINANLHADEGYFNKNNVWEYSNIGLHLEFVPVATGFKQGLQVQNSMNKALKSMRYTNPDCYSEWAKNEQKRLEEITKEYMSDVEFYHPVADKTREGNKTKEQHELEQQLKDALDAVKTALEQAQAKALIITSQARRKAQNDAQESLDELNKLLEEAQFKDEKGDMRRYMESIVVRTNSRGMKITAWQDYLLKKYDGIDSIRRRAESLFSNENEDTKSDDYSL